jgi:hypothetical protein
MWVTFPIETTTCTIDIWRKTIVSEHEDMIEFLPEIAERPNSHVGRKSFSIPSGPLTLNVMSVVRKVTKEIVRDLKDKESDPKH